MENIYVESIADKKSILLCRKLGLFSSYYDKHTTYEQLLPQDKVAFSRMRKNIEHNLRLLSVSSETIDRHLQDAQDMFGISYEQAQTLIGNQTTFLVTSADNWQYFINGIQRTFGFAPRNFEELVAFSEIMFQKTENLQETVDAYQRIGLDKTYLLNNKQVLTATPYSIEAKYMFGVVNGLEQFNLPYRQDIIRQNFNKTVARHRYIQQLNQVLTKAGEESLPQEILFERDEEFFLKINDLVKNNQSMFETTTIYTDADDLLKNLRPDITYLRDLQSQYQMISSTTFEGDKLKYPMIILSQEYEDRVLEGLRTKVTQQERDRKAKEIQQTLGIPLDQAKRMINQNSNLLIYSTQALTNKVEEWRLFFGCKPEEIIDKFVSRPTLINYEIKTIADKSQKFSMSLGMVESDFRPLFLQNLEIATEDTSKFDKKISDLVSLGYSKEHIADHLKEVVRLSYGIKEKFMITQIASAHKYQCPRVAGKYQDFNKYFFEEDNHDKLGRTSLALMYAKFRFFYDGIQSENDNKLEVPQGFNTYFLNTKDMIKQYAQTIGSEIPGFEVDKERTLLHDIPELGLTQGATFEELYPILQAELIKKYPFDESAYELLQSEYDQLENVPPITILDSTAEQAIDQGQTSAPQGTTITQEEQSYTIRQAKKSADNILQGGREQNE